MHKTLFINLGGSKLDAEKGSIFNADWHSDLAKERDKLIAMLHSREVILNTVDDQIKVDDIKMQKSGHDLTLCYSCSDYT